MGSTRWWKYITGIIGDSTYSEAATKAGFDKSAFTRWKKGARADPDFVVKVARAYNANVLEALVAAEFITEEEAKLVEVAPRLSLRLATDEQLTDELLRRLKLLDTAPVDELAQRRSNSAATLSEPSDMPFDVVADSSPEEDWEGAEFD